MRLLYKLTIATVIILSFPKQVNSQYVQPMRYDHYSFTQQVNIGVGTSRATNASAYLEVGPVSGANKGLLPPRLTAAQMNAIASPAAGLFVYNTDSAAICYYNGSVWRKVSQGGSTGTGKNFGEADTLFTANRYVNQAGYTMSYKSGQSIFGAEKRQIGTRYNHAWSSLTGWTDNTATATVTTDGTGTTISGGAWNLNNYLSLNNEVLTSHNYKISQTIVINSKTSTSYGFGIRILPLAAGQAIFAHFLLSDTAGYIAFVSTNQVSITGDANNDAYTKFLWSSGDTLDLTLTRTGYEVFMEMKNRTTKSQSKLFIDKIDPTPLGTAPGSVALFTYGGDYKLIDNFNIEYFDTYQPKWLTMGHSINYGADAFTEGLKWTAQTFENEGGGWVDVSANSIASIDGTLMMSDILTNIKPQNAIIDFVVNDKQGSVPLDSFSKRMTRIITQFQAAGTNPVLVTGILTGSSCVTYNDTIWALASRYNLKVIDAYTALLGSGTDMLAIFNYGDNIHWKQEGHTQVAGTAKAALRSLLSPYSPINLENIPQSFERKYTLGLDNNGNLVKSLFKGDTSYIRNIGTTLSARNATPGSINIKGNAWIGGTDFRVFGSGTYTSPILSVNLDGDGYVKAALFKSNGVNFGSSYISLGSDGFNFFMNDIRSYQRPWTVNLNYPNTAGNIGVIFNTTNDDGGGNLQASYKFLSIRNNTVEKLHINRGGGLWLDSLAKYSKNMGSIYDDRTLVDKRYVDSSLSTVGGGDMTIYTRQQDTLTLAAFGGGSGNAGDTVAFTTSTIYGSFYNYGSDTLIITKMQVGLQGTSANVDVQCYWNDSLNVIAGASVLLADENRNCTNIYTGTSLVSLINYKIPPGVWVWVKTPIVTTKPTYFSLSLIGYKKRVY